MGLLTLASMGREDSRDLVMVTVWWAGARVCFEERRPAGWSYCGRAGSWAAWKGRRGCRDGACGRVVAVSGRGSGSRRRRKSRCSGSGSGYGFTAVQGSRSARGDEQGAGGEQRAAAGQDKTRSLSRGATVQCWLEESALATPQAARCRRVLASARAVCVSSLPVAAGAAALWLSSDAKRTLKRALSARLPCFLALFPWPRRRPYE